MNFDIKEFARDLADVQTRMLKAGIEGERAWMHPYLNAIFVAYDRAKEDPQARLPTVLMAAIEGARSALGDCAVPANPYEERRSTQRASDTELSVDGRQIRPGE